ncbi:CocE/NonD family hydrolase [Paenibacillus planticolens]|uniref:CocE/NonD family hydrolase n=1 Tax=Paenibacillus planticolens TaxID=2654976 RepID=A0ABX1ZMG8_9BACL|nr:CocE/NonD family hydrolase [Paenibacillus planticolens]NOV01276.1 CocE/NonD family hydrolase [Paenibacillus planticolens]
MSETTEHLMPEPTHEVGEYHKVMVPMRDNIRLATHVWLPEGKGPWPVLLMRNPYVNSSDVYDPSFVLFARYGYAVVLQECRGRGSSEGTWEPYVNERSDGLDTLDWLVRQTWQDGSIGLYGGSYLSFNQWILADCLPPEVKTLYLSVMGTDLYRFAYMDGMFKPDIYTSWALSNSGKDWGEADLAEMAHNAYRIWPPIEMDEKLLGKRLPWYRDFIANSGSGDSLWNEGLWGLLKSMPPQINIPVCMVCGWFDIALETMFTAFHQLRPDIRDRSRFTVGPWVHSLVPYGDLDYPGGRVDGPNGGTKAALDWFDAMVKNQPYKEQLGVVHTYVIGDKGWRTWEQWPPENDAMLFYLNEGKSLGKRPSAQPASFSYEYDPKHPVPTAGGSTLLSVYGDSPYLPKAASVLQPEAGSRPDVISFLSEPLAQDLLVAGQMRVGLHVSSTAADTAFTVKLMEVFASGEAYNFADGITSLAYRNGSSMRLSYEPGTIVSISIELWPITWRLKSGSRLRLDVSSSNFPAYHVHPNVAGNWGEQGSPVTAKQCLYGGGDLVSFVRLPVARYLDIGNVAYCGLKGNIPSFANRFISFFVKIVVS